MKKIFITFLAIFIFKPAFCQLDGCTVDIRVELDLPFDDAFYSYGPRVLEVVGATIGSGVELDLSNEVGNPSGFYGALTIDISGSNIIISSDDLFYTSGYPGFAACQIASVQITNLNCPNGCIISNVITNNNDVFQSDIPGGYGYGYSPGYFTFTQSFTDNSIILNWIIDDQMSDNTFWMEENNVSDFTIVCDITNDCEEEIIGSILTQDPGCDVSGIDITIFAPDGTSITVSTNSEGTFTVPGGPFPCGTYTAAFSDPTQVPACFSENGSTEPITFDVDGTGNGDDGPNFIANPSVPTLSQWGTICLFLLLLVFGTVKIASEQLETIL